MDRSHFQSFIGVDLGGAKGKSTALAKVERSPEAASVLAILMRAPDGSPWTDDTLLDYFRGHDPACTVLAINAPLTSPACVRCTLKACPGYANCVDPATVWLRDIGQDLLEEAVMSDRNRIVAVPSGKGFRSQASLPPAATQRLPPYTHRCTEVDLHYRRGLLPKEQLGQSSWAIINRAAHLRKVLASLGFALNTSLLEVSPRCTVSGLFGEEAAKRYKRDADPWHTRAAIVEGMKDLSFSTTSRLGREEVLRNDNCFDALLSAYTAYLWAIEGWPMPEGEPFASDGWIWAPRLEV